MAIFVAHIFSRDTPFLSRDNQKVDKDFLMGVCANTIPIFFGACDRVFISTYICIAYLTLIL